MKKWAWGFIALLAVPAVASGSSNVSDKPQCQRGDLKCVDHVIQEMSQRYAKLEKACDHDAIFSLFYLRTTETYRATAPTLGYQDVNSVTREDSLFADYYFRAFDAYHSGNGQVPAAWQIAFDAAKAKLVTVAGDALLGFNAHIQRDLPFALYDLYQRGKPVSEFDHFLVNQFLAQVDVVDEVIARYDPAYPTGGDSSFIYYWRAVAWQNYLLLRDAPSDEARALVAANIEQAAAQAAIGIVYVSQFPAGQNSAARDAYCAAH